MEATVKENNLFNFLIKKYYVRIHSLYVAGRPKIVKVKLDELPNSQLHKKIIEFNE
jgi:hypothetical protein